MSRLWSNSSELDGYPSAPGFQKHSTTSAAGAQRIKPHVESLEDVVLSLLRVHGPMTDFELQAKAEAEGIRSLLRPRRARLTEKGEIADAKFKRPAPSGVSVTVWRLA